MNTQLSRTNDMLKESVVMPGACRLGDKAECPLDAHGCVGCPHRVSGPVVQGSSDVIVNGKPIARKGDSGVHGVCCGPNRFVIAQGSPTVTANGKPVARSGDMTMHCGGIGKMVQGSSNVIIGNGKGRAFRMAAEKHAPFLYKDWNGEWRAGFPPDDYWPDAKPEYGAARLPCGGYDAVNCRIYRDPATIRKDNETWRWPIVKDGKVYPAEGTGGEPKKIPMQKEKGKMIERIFRGRNYRIKKDGDGMPIFTIFETYIDDNHIGNQDEPGHFKAANQRLKELLEDPDNTNLAKKLGLTPEQEEFIRSEPSKNASPPGLTWHHHQDACKMQLVPTMLHSRFQHIGGMEIWGGGR